MADALAHQRVIGGMELDQVEAIALAVHGAEPGRILVGHPSEIERLGRAIVPAAGGERRDIEARAGRGVGQWPVGGEQVDVAEGGRLVERSVFEEAGGAHEVIVPHAPLSRQRER